MRTVISTWVIVLPIYVLMISHVGGLDVNITYVKSAVAKGAVCLDGSPPAYHFSPGFGSGVDNWLVHLEGGSWCNNVTSCLARRDTPLGSSKFMGPQVPFLGILSDERHLNPDFFNWNKVFVLYCDGSSFTGDVEKVDPKTKLYYRGARVFVAVVDDLKAKGMGHASHVLLSGCSAGGLAAIINCDKLSSLMPQTTTVKCLSDAGYFINIKDISGAQYIQEFYNGVESTKNLPSYCTSKMSPGLCFFPENMAQKIQTPLFLLNSDYDAWQIRSILIPDVADPHNYWFDCKNDLGLCSSQQLDTIHGFRKDFLAALSKGDGNTSTSSRGFFINSCYTHCQTRTNGTWISDGSPVLNNTPIAKAIGDWYFQRNPFQVIDCPYPCDSTCLNGVFGH